MAELENKTDTVNEKEKKKFPIALIIILVVIGACGFIAIISTIVIIAINPAQNFSKARDAQRNADVNNIASAIRQYYIEEETNGEQLFSEIISCDIGSESIEREGNLYSYLVDDYLVTLPLDPQSSTNSETGYAICVTENAFIIAAPFTEEGDIIRADVTIKK